MRSYSAPRSCTICDKENANFCARCKCTSYCSKACQQSDWSTHKLLCASFPAFPTSTRPSPNHYPAVLFNPDKAKPEFTWLLCKSIHDDEDGGSFQSPDTDTMIGGPDTMIRPVPIQYNSRLKRAVRNTLVVEYRDTFFVDGSRPNKSVAAVTATQPGEYHEWRGPIVTYARLGQGIEPSACKDFDMVDFRHVTDYFLSYAYKPPKPKANVERVKGVRINCLGDVKMLKRPQFEAVEIPTTDAIFTEHDTSDIADKIGIPILTRRCPPDPKWVNSKHAMFAHKTPTTNQDATFLHQCCDPGAEFDLSIGSLGWGWCPMRWQSDVGSVVVVRKDKKLLLPMHMEALARYCRYDVQPILAHSIGDYHPEEPIKKEDVLRIICRPMFVIYWSKFMSEKNGYGTASPYDNDL